MKFSLPEIPPPKLITALRNYNLLPAIIFLPTRRKCDAAASEVAADKSQKTELEKQQKRRELYEKFVAEFPEIKSHKHRKILLRSGIASHHAGHMPAWKLLVEKMMSQGLLSAIFATSTVAAGVDFPARTVVISNADTLGNAGWRSLQASELQQMTGRAGRRGKDKVGFVVLAPGQFQNLNRIARLLKSPPEPLSSQFRATYTSLLNLLDAFGNFAQVREIVEKSFAFREIAHQILKLERKCEKSLEKLREKLKDNEFELDEADALGFQRLTSARNRLQEKLPRTRTEIRRTWLRENVRIGRVITKTPNNKKFFLVLNILGEKVIAMREDGQGVTLSLSQIGRVFKKEYRLGEVLPEQLFADIHEGKNPALEEPQISWQNQNADEAVEVINRAINRLLGENLSEDAQRRAFQLLWETWNEAECLEKTSRDIENLRGEIWLPFERRAKVLDYFGYLDFPRQKVTERGKWLADVRVDRPLLVGEALRHGIFEDLRTEQLAALMAALAADADRNYGEIYLSEEVLDLLTEFENIVFEVSKAEWKFGVEPAPELNFSAAAATEIWTKGAEWEDLVFRTRAEEGDLVRLFSRTGEALRQIAQLKNSNPQVAELAAETAKIVLREPVR